ncbi:MAG: ribonuclease E/G [Clostridium sp.]|uniref:ribonuclease E/G n=1 Tax=Clostridium sp. TaxID=1506 RepID=UPI0025BD4D83|nr:ribonuclease E/G [Clostridium sp.]MCH3964723.1 ribonuclease E/G [Clostridium sp.]MCI1715194.1 ribonuclease E/G [Clostridium sp.]MCI1799456.1 ribonuclease E/G [Clostridium sp.]MCI1813377.1 ribonuclease E/G [Clostridium sp.]MCI1870268.1 ribonuclease E/G [Clostridium sp.]
MKYIFIDRNREFLRTAIMENGDLKEIFFEKNDEAYPGEMYKGIVKNIVPAIKCAFIDIGKDKNAYMYVDSRFKNIGFKKGEELLVQVVKEDLGKKGPKVVSSISMPGKYCVLNNFSGEIEFSRKILDNEFKDRIINNLKLPERIGIKVRTDAQNISVDVIQNEFNELYETYKNIIRKSEYALKPGLIFNGGGLVEKILRDKLKGHDFKIYASDGSDYENIRRFLKKYNYDVDNVEFYNESGKLFSFHDIDSKILALRNRRVYLKCGGYIVIDRTEAMYVIDVNSGKNVKNRSMGKTVFTTNFQAAEEIVRQIRLRNLSGIILIDFIDMDKIENKRKIIDILNSGFDDDSNKTIVYPFTELNLVQIARKRSGRPISDYIDEDCAYCRGMGHRIKLSYMSMLIENEIDKINEMNIHIQIGNNYKNDIEENVSSFLKDIGGEEKNIYLTYGHGEYFKIEPLVFSSQIDELEKFKLQV